MNAVVTGSPTGHRSVIIIGSGPSGYTAAIYAARADLRPLVFEGSQAGGALTTTTDVENFPGFPEGIMGPELMDQLRAQAERFGAELVADDVTAVDFSGRAKSVTTPSGTFTADTVILSMGSAYKKLGIEGEERLSGRGVSWCATCDGFFFRGKAVAVVGGGDTAMEEALFLTRFASSVTIVHRRGAFRASGVMARRAMAHPKIAVIWDSTVVAVEGDTAVTGVTVRNRRTGEDRPLPVEGLFVAIGHEPRSDLVRDHVEVDGEGYVVVTSGTRTSVPGVFASGDLVDRTYRQAITAAGTGCQAALDAGRLLAGLDAAAGVPAVV